VARRWSGQGTAAGVSTLLAFGAGVLANVATSQWTWSVGTALLVLVVVWIGVEVWRASHGSGAAHPGRAVEPGTRLRPWMAPPLERMVERPELTGQLASALLAAEPTEVAMTTGLRGAGGFGKTTLAAWMCHRPELPVRYPGGLLWVTLGQEVRGADLAERANDLACALSGRRPSLSEPDAAGAELGRLLDEQQEPVLLVIDDVWQEAQLRPFRFGGRRCTRLVTTRIPDLLPVDGQHIVVDAMSLEQARHLVADGVAGLAVETAEQLARAAGRWPVLLNLLNGVLRRRVERGQLAQEAAEQVRETLVADGPGAFDPARPAERSRAVAATVEASLALLTPQDRRNYLDLAIFPEDVDIPLSVLGLLWPGTRVERLCDDLTALGLVADYRLDAPGPRLVVHDVLRAYLRTRHGAEEGMQAHRRLTTAAGGLLSGPAEEGVRPWWTLLADADYLWRYLPQPVSRRNWPHWWVTCAGWRPRPAGWARWWPPSPTWRWWTPPSLPCCGARSNARRVCWARSTLPRPWARHWPAGSTVSPSWRPRCAATRPRCQSPGWSPPGPCRIKPTWPCRARPGISAR
jgi:hypothetical protein